MLEGAIWQCVLIKYTRQAAPDTDVIGQSFYNWVWSLVTCPAILGSCKPWSQTLRLKLLHCGWLLGRELPPSSNSCGSVPILNVFFTEMLNLILCSEWVWAVSGLGLARPSPCSRQGSCREERRYMRQAIRRHEISTINRYEFGNWWLIPWLIECQTSLCWCEGEVKLVILCRWPGLRREIE